MTTQSDLDDAIANDIEFRNQYGGRVSPYAPFDAGQVGSVIRGDAMPEGRSPLQPGWTQPTPDIGGVGEAIGVNGGNIYNAPVGGPVGVDSGAGMIYNSPN
ncbi:hypothetical protein HFO56_00375 [Rhizobium laguerreae]|uniref:hypothetical protein n=1 Tax=Rhizobium laguerreae TaxID=1076926 RepID=UPI001C91958E|nr:hypothetical protein [Rhizobium laguerreae]MBY3150883.1 hypothetical protein [Rhizobium laguerreae]MBY3433065.1 hypothetical protein [Rhizobium laguerreae]